MPASLGTATAMNKCRFPRDGEERPTKTNHHAVGARGSNVAPSSAGFLRASSTRQALHGASNQAHRWKFKGSRSGWAFEFQAFGASG